MEGDQEGDQSEKLRWRRFRQGVESTSYVRSTVGSTYVRTYMHGSMLLLSRRPKRREQHNGGQINGLLDALTGNSVHWVRLKGTRQS